jgi:hypothetical protein
MYIPIPQNGYHVSKDTIEAYAHNGLKYLGFWKHGTKTLDIFYRKKVDNYVGIYYDGTSLVEIQDCAPFDGTLKGKVLSSGIVIITKDGPIEITVAKGKFVFKNS